MQKVSIQIYPSFNLAKLCGLNSSVRGQVTRVRVRSGVDLLTSTGFTYLFTYFPDYWMQVN